MVVGWICSRDLFETSWEGLREVLPIVIAEESRMFTCVLSLPQCRCYRKFEPLASHTNVHAGCGRSWRAFLKRFLVEMILTTMHTEAKKTGTMPVLLRHITRAVFTYSLMQTREGVLENVNVL